MLPEPADLNLRGSRCSHVFAIEAKVCGTVQARTINALEAYLEQEQDE